jgi:putative tryptophan/tyrosine transport system substrate-binding protein
MAKRVDILKQAIPRLARVGVLVNPESITYKLMGLRSLEPLAQALNVKAQPLEVRRLDELDAALTLAKTQTDAVVVSEEILFYTGGTPRRIADLAIRSRMPSVGFAEYAEPGGLIGYGVDFFDLWRRSMTFVDKILRGANPANLPVEQPTKFELVINLKTAKALGVTIPPLVLARADRVIE